MSFNVKISGLEQIQAKIKKHGEVVEKAVQIELDKFGIKVVAKAKQRCPVDEGFLRNSINMKSERLKVAIVVGAFYAAYVEFGTRAFAAAHVASLTPEWKEFAARWKTNSDGSKGMRAQPYLVPSVEEERLELQKRIKTL